MSTSACYETSSVQRRLFTLQQFNPQSTAYNLPAVFKVQGRLNITKFEQAVKVLVERHESMRTTFIVDLDTNEILQNVLENIHFSINYITCTEDELEATLKNIIQPFDLAQAPLFRIHVLCISDEEQYLCFDIHHIVADGTSIQNIMKEIVCLYNDLPLSPVEVQYVDYVMWQNDLFANGEMDFQENYWLEQLKGELPVLDLQTDYARPSVRNGSGHTLYFELNTEVVQQIRQLAQQAGSTLFMVLLAIYSSILYRHTDQDDLIIGTPIAGRRSTELESVIGMFVNTLALRIRPTGEMTFRELLHQVKQTTLSAYDHQDYPLDLIVEKLNIPRTSGRNPIFDTMFVLQNMSMQAVELDGLRFSPYPQQHSSAKFDISLEINEEGDQLKGKLEYSSELFALDTMERMVSQFVRITSQIAVQPDLPLHQLQLLNTAEEQKLLQQFNDHASDYPLYTIDQLFEEQVIRYPENTAISYNGKIYTYRELNERANSLARLLQTKGVIPGSAVGIIAERSLELIVGIVAVSKAGAAYVPIEPDYPAERIQHMLTDSGSQWLLVQGEYAYHKEDMCIIDLLDSAVYTQDYTNLELNNNPENTAIIIFTSGTTGRPKGILIKHKGISRLVKNTNYVNLDQHTRMLQTCALGFDVFTFETWAPLLHGGTLYLTDKSTYLDATRLKPFLLEHDINIMVPTTALFNHLISEDVTLFNSLQTVIVAGEAMSASHAQLLMQQQAKVTLINGYGPAESTSYTTAYQVTIDDQHSVPIGKPISNTTCYVVDRYDQPVPIGVVGELLIGGAGIAGGYANRIDLTTEKFIIIPHLETGILYRTGDLVKWRADGNLIYIGRRDDQIKIRGYRIELEEIKQQILSLPCIREAVIVPIKEKEQETRICAYYTANGIPDITDLRSKLQQKLPEFMVPQLYMQLENMPLSANHKINLKQLPIPEQPKVNHNSLSLSEQQFKDELEQTIGAVWSEVLEIPEIGANDHFFEMGGHSLKAVLIIAKLRKVLEVDIGIEDIFNQPTVREMADQLRYRQQEKAIQPQLIEKREFYPATSQQTRFFVMEKMKRKSDTSNNITDAQWILGPLDIQQFKKVGKQVMARHESLRLSHKLIGEQVFFKIHDNLELPFQLIKATEEEMPQLIQQFIRPYDLSQPPLFRIGLIQIHPEKHLLLFDIHHSIADGFSLGLLAKEFINLLAGNTLSPLPFQYKEYAAWQQSIQQSESWKRQEQYWLNTLNGDIPQLQLPLDYIRPVEQSYEGAFQKLVVDQETTMQLKQLAIKTNTTLYMLLLTAYFTLLHYYSGDEDIVIGIPVAGRNQAEFQQLIGMFVNTIVLRNQPVPDKTFYRLLMEVRQHTLEAFNHQDYPLDLLLEKLEIQPVADRNPLFQTLFVLQNMDIPLLQAKELDFQPYVYEQHTNIIDLSLIITEKDEELICTFEYGIHLFQEDTIRGIAEHFTSLLSVLTTTDIDHTLADLYTIVAPARDQVEVSPDWLTDTFSF
ncbi:non-ribosomal peptide synthetase [Paenibacillus nicotianae]|uniref:Non-ribosomal peptide synthetase n=1 Tax=Paenibacillus nicotianae TaxID=1526551 RepID=A0ABW4URJ1_9BACL